MRCGKSENQLNDISLDRLVFLHETGFNLYILKIMNILHKNTKTFVSLSVKRERIKCFNLHGLTGQPLIFNIKYIYSNINFCL